MSTYFSTELLFGAVSGKAALRTTCFLSPTGTVVEEPCASAFDDAGWWIGATGAEGTGFVESMLCDAEMDTVGRSGS